jgi:hypothetical protein
MMRKRILWVVLVALIILSSFGGYWLLSHPIIERYFSSVPSPVTIRLKIKPKNLAVLEDVAANAHERGYIVQTEDPYVKAILVFNGEEKDVEIRLKGKMLDHVSGDKWSFRVKTRAGDEVLGMRRFSLQHPGTRNYAWDWFYHKWCADEDIIALRYSFVNLVLNGTDLGIYALEENFDFELLINNKRPKGLIFRINPDAYWLDRLQKMNSIYPYTPATSYFEAPIEPFSKGITYRDTMLVSQLNRLNSRWIMLNKGLLSVGELFDVVRCAKRYAILDILGGFHSVDWSDLKFYYNLETDKIEPIAYESFGGRYISTLIGCSKYQRQLSGNCDIHDILFSDSLFMATYISELRSVSSPKFQIELARRYASDIAEQERILFSEFPYKKMDMNAIRYNADIIREILDFPLMLVAYYSGIIENSFDLDLRCRETLPVVIDSAVYDGNEVFIPSTKPVIPPFYGNGKRDFYKVKFMGDTRAISLPLRHERLKVYYRILGDSLTKWSYVLPQNTPNSLSFIEPKCDDFVLLKPFIKNNNLIYIDQVIDLKEDICVPKGYRILFSRGSGLRGNNKAHFHSESPVWVQGSSDFPVRFENVDIKLIEIGDSITWMNFYSYNSNLKFYGCTLQLKEASINNSEVGLDAVRSVLDIYNVNIQNGHLGFKFLFSSASMNRFSMINLDTGLSILHSKVFSEYLHEANETRVLYSLKNGSELIAYHHVVTDCELLFEVQNGVHLSASKWIVGDYKAIAFVNDDDSLYAQSQLDFFKFSGISWNSIPPIKGGRVNVDGQIVRYEAP